MTNQVIGYGRVSTADQDLSSQLDALKVADRVFVEKVSGTKASRPEWDRCRDTLRSGDTLLVTRLDRLGRSTKDLLEISSWLAERKVSLRVLEQPIDTTTDAGKLFFTMIAAFAEFEHAMMVSRTKDGLAAARARGRNGGRRPKLSSAQAKGIRRRYDAGETVQAIAASFNVSRPTVYRALEQVGGQAAK